jgi:ribose transport system substrate-binding protein
MFRKSLLFQIVLVIAVVAVISGCGGAARATPTPMGFGNTPTPAAGAATAPPPAATTAPAATAAPAAAGEDVKGKFYWVQSSAWHPVHQYTQQGFLAGCDAEGLDCELATTDENTLEALVAMVDQTLAQPDNKGTAMWFGGNPAVLPLVRKAVEKGIPIVFPHFPVDQSFYENAPNVVQIAADTTKYPDPVAKAMCDELAKQGVTSGSIAVTENGHNATEDMVAKVFTDGIAKYCPQFKVLETQLEGPEPTQAIAVATSIIQANPDIVAALSTTGGGPTTWAGAQKETGKKIVAVGMDATEVNLDLVKNGEVWGLVAQPLYDETFGAPDLLHKMANGETVPYWTVLDAPLVTVDNEQPYYDLLAKLSPKFRKAVNPDDAAAVATATAEAAKQ